MMSESSFYLDIDIPPCPMHKTDLETRPPVSSDSSPRLGGVPPSCLASWWLRPPLKWPVDTGSESEVRPRRGGGNTGLERNKWDLPDKIRVG